MKPKKTCMQKICHGEEKDKKRKGFDLKNSGEEKYYSMDSIKYKEINPYKRRSNPKRET